MRSYYPGITIFKLAGALLVLLSHVILVRYVEAIPSGKLQFVMLISRTIVPCFYMVAGFLAYEGWTRSESSHRYMQRYLSRIVLLYAAFCVLFAAQFTIPDLIRHGLSLSNLILQAKILIVMVFLNGPFIQLWFIPPLIFGMIISFRWLNGKRPLKAPILLTLGGFILCQFFSGSLRGVFMPPTDNSSMLELLITRYIGFGLTFVFAGALLAKYKDRLLKLRIGRALLLSALFTAAETALLLYFAEWSTAYKLTFSILPNTMLLFYGILCIRGRAIQAYHKPINLFTIVTFFGHVPLMRLNLFILGLDVNELGLPLQLGQLFLTFVECLGITLLFVYRDKYQLPAQKERPLRRT